MNVSAMDTQGKPWVSFCMSTYKRPEFLKEALEGIARQTFRNFEVIVSDNDPECSGEKIVSSFNDPRFRYFSNDENLGMIRSFNKSIDRSTADYIVMITDDDPVYENFLSELNELYQQHKNYSVYAGFLRPKLPAEAVETITAEDFAAEVLDVNKTSWMLWSSAVLCKKDVLAIGKIPDYGSPHLADHALLALTGSMNGAVIKNKMYSSLSSHDTNFSKFNFNYYTTGCKGFYETMHSFAITKTAGYKIENAVTEHLNTWFISCMFNLKKYYTVHKNLEMLQQVNHCCKEILDFKFMRSLKPHYYIKNLVFTIKRTLGLVKI